MTAIRDNRDIASRTTRVLANQAERLGFTVESVEVAATGSAYILLSHAQLDGDRLVRVADHEPNEARYQANVNREPDLLVDEGWQLSAVEIMAGWIGVDPECVAYIRQQRKRQQTQERKRTQARNERQRRDAMVEARKNDLLASLPAPGTPELAEMVAPKTPSKIARNELAMDRAKQQVCDELGIAFLYEGL